MAVSRSLRILVPFALMAALAVLWWQRVGAPPQSLSKVPVSGAEDSSPALSATADPANTGGGPGAPARRRSEVDSSDASGFQSTGPHERISLRVLDPEHKPIPGALVAPRADGDGEVRAANADGLVLVGRPASGERCELWISAEGFLGASLVLVAESGVEEDVVLQPSGRLSGYVADELGGPVEGAVVYAMPSGELESLDLEAVPGFLMGSHWPMATSDAAGYFRIDGVEVGVRYHVSCGAPGRLCHEPENHARAGMSDIRLRVAPAYGAIVRFEQRDGARVTGRPGTQGIQASLAPDATLVRGSAVTALLSLSLFVELPQLSATELVLMAHAQSVSSHVGPIRVQQTIPGFPPVDAEVELPSCAGGLGEIVLPIGAGPAGLGSLQIVFVRDCDRIGSQSGMAKGVGTLILEPSTSAMETLRVGLRASANGPTVIKDLPFGDYRARFVSSVSGVPFSTAPEDLTISPKEARFELDGGSTGVLEFVGEEHDSPGTASTLVISLGTPLPAPGADRASYQLSGIKGQSWCAFLEAPRRIPFLPPGEYAIAMDLPEFTFGGREWALATVRDGEVTTVEYRSGQ
jgi:hypothetical protein